MELVIIHFKKSLQQHLSCLQDGQFLAKFFIEHHRDKNLDISNQRYWVKYHSSNDHKTLSVDYHIIQPSQYLEATARSKHLVPYIRNGFTLMILRCAYMDPSTLRNLTTDRLKTESLGKRLTSYFK
jgi:hypothetical protein